MSTANSRNQIPEGVRDRLPREAARMRTLSARLEDVFRAWGYREVVTPGFEYLDTVSAGAGTMGRREDLYQLFDRKGRTLALRADMTTPIARMAVTKLAGDPLPLRLSYFAPVFRHRDRKAGSANEIWQAGVELIGASGAAADAEIIAIACAALSATGLEGLKIGLGHVDFVEGIFAEAGVTDALETELKEAMVARDLVAYEKGVTQADLGPVKTDLLLSLVEFQGSFEQAKARYQGVGNGRVARALEQLSTVIDLLNAYGVGGQVSLDLGLARSLGYYTGIVFEGYAPGVGAPVMGGGRYDNLLADFGGDAPATGFALEMDRLLAALERQGRLVEEPGLDVIVECPVGREAEAMNRARELRLQGFTVEVDLLGRSGPELQAYARQRGAARVVDPGGTVSGETPVQRTRLSGLNSIH